MQAREMVGGRFNLHRLLVHKIDAHKHSVQSVESSERMPAVYVQIDDRNSSMIYCSIDAADIPEKSQTAFPWWM